MNGEEGAIAHSTGVGLWARGCSSRLLFDVFADAVFHLFVAALNTVSGASDEPGRTETEDEFLVLKVLFARDEARFDDGGDVDPLAAAAEEEFSDGHAGGEHQQLRASTAFAV